MLARTTALFIACFVAAPLQSPADVPPFRVKLFSDQVRVPICIAQAPGNSDYLFASERTGVIRVLEKTSGELASGGGVMLDLSAMVNTDVDNGLLGLAFDPDYAENGYFYVNYNGRDGTIVLERYHIAAGETQADPASAYPILRYPRPTGHNGGWIGFSPLNGLLYITSGDGGLGGTPDFANHAQTIVNERLGKILRIDPRGDDFPEDPDRNYRIPPSNPFVDRTGDDEIWAIGVRNPWRASFDRLTGDLYFGDVGMDNWEEVNFEPASSTGATNFGWPCMEGTHCTISQNCECDGQTLTLPVFDYSHTTGLAVVGGFVYRGAAIPALDGRYLFADFLSARYWSLRIGPGGSVSELTDRSSLFIPAGSSTPVKFVSAWGEDAAGELYLCSLATNKIYKLVPYLCEPEIDIQPGPQSKPVGQSLTLRIVGYGESPLTYQWLKDGTPVEPESGRVSGTETDTLSISSAQETDSGLYSVVLTSPCGTLASAAATVRVFTCPSADFNADGTLGVQDLFDFLAGYFADDPRADFNANGSISVQDILDYLTAYFAGCR